MSMLWMEFALAIFKIKQNHIDFVQLSRILSKFDGM